MATLHRPFRDFPQRLHGPRIAVLATIAQDRPALSTVAAQRRASVQLQRLRLTHLSRVQLRSRDGAEPFIARVDVAIDHAGRIRAAFDTDRATSDALAGATGTARMIRHVGTNLRKPRASSLRWRLHRVALPTIDRGDIEARGFVRQPEPARLCSIGMDASGRPMLLAPAAASAFVAMRTAAARSGVVLQPVSSFRSIAYQRGLIVRKLKRGDPLDAILRVNAAPGYSEHHSGRAVDIGTPGCAALDEAFEQTPAFAWLQQHAADFGFHLSYPRNNALGVIYEPWHWYSQADYR
jgi:D-alanyl-D-alanine carboxypeptidase